MLSSEPRIVVSERADDGHESLAERDPDLAGAHAARLADEPQPGHAIGLDDAIGERQRGEPRGLECGAQLVGDGRQAFAHAHERLEIGEAPAGDEARLDAARSRQRADSRAAAVHDAHARPACHPRDLGNGVERRIPAELDHDEAAHVVYSALNVTYSGESEDA